MNDLESGWPQYRAVLSMNEAMGRELEAERDEVELKKACIKGMREQMDKMEAELAALRENCSIARALIVDALEYSGVNISARKSLNQALRLLETKEAP